MSDRMKQLMESGRREEVIHLSEEAGRIANEGINCCINRWKLSHTGELSSEAFSSLLGEACPEMPPLMKEELLQLIDSKR